MTFLTVWVIWAFFGGMMFSIVFIWAVRNRQFSDLDRAGRIPLESARLIEPDPAERKPSRADRISMVVLFLLTLGMVVATLWIGVRGG